jgi:hypothetical protein
MACPRRGNEETVKEASATTIIAHLVHVLNIDCIDHPPQSTAAPALTGESVFDFRRGLFKCLTVYYSTRARLEAFSVVG